MCKRTDEGLARGLTVSGVGARAVIRRVDRAPHVMQQMFRLLSVFGEPPLGG